MTVHYFPPNPDKIGDNLLTAALALDTASGGWSSSPENVRYYAKPIVCDILQKFLIDGVDLTSVSGLEQSSQLAHELRASGASTVDLQQLNCWVDYPELRQYFDRDLPRRALLDWFDPEAVARWPLEPFHQIFRGLTGISATGRRLVPRDLDAVDQRSVAPDVLLFPHCETDFQQLQGWGDLAHSLTEHFPHLKIGVVGSIAARGVATWPAEVAMHFALSGKDLALLVQRASVCIGGATGLTHLAGAVGTSTLGIWRHDDRTVFGPQPGWTVRTLVAPAISGHVASTCHTFVAEHCP
jgi:hypothetical protein